MRRYVVRLFPLVSLLALIFAPHVVAGEATPVTVTTRSYDTNRTGANLNETTLTTANVNVDHFGKLFTRRVEGQIYAQPLYMPNLAIPGKGTHNVVFVATQRNNVYAFDADDPGAATPLWSRSLGAFAVSAEGEFGTRYGPYRDIQPYVGITSTPVIDLQTQTIYVVPFIKLGAGQYEHRLYALDLLTGASKFGSPVKISATASGLGDGSVNNVLIFNSKQQLQRAGLLLLNGVVYMAFASYGDTDPYHGWVLGYNATTLQREVVYVTTPNGSEGGIWQSGQALSADANGDIYLVTANGTFNADTGGSDRGESVLRLRRNGDTLNVETWFTPYNYSTLNTNDTDLGSTGALLIPNTNLVLSGSKQGKVYLLDRDNMGSLGNGNDNQIVQSFQVAPDGNHIHGSPVYWNSPDGPLVYVWADADYLKAYKLVGNQLQTPPFRTSTMSALPNSMPGGILSLSANGSTPSTGIVWASLVSSGDANGATRPGLLRALDAADVSHELWNSDMLPARDKLGNFPKFNPPLVANGKVYLGSFADNAGTVPDELVVYGLLDAPVITAVAGSNQSTPITTPFTTQLKVKVTKAYGQEPLSGVKLTFTAPTNGASATFTNNAPSITVTTDANGEATVPARATNTLGSYMVTATVDSNVGAGVANFLLTNVQMPFAMYLPAIAH